MKLFTLLIALSFGYQSTSAIDLDSLLFKSVGGEEGLKTVSTMISFRATGEVTMNGLKGRFVQIVVPPNKIYYELNFPQFSIKQGYDGEVGWQTDLNGRVSRISGFEEAELTKTLYTETYSHVVPGRLAGRAAYVKDSVIDGVAYPLVEFYPQNKDTLRVLYDAVTGERVMQLSKLDNITTIISFDETVVVQNVPIPFRQSSVAIGVPLVIDWVIDTAQFNVPVDGAIFVQPGSSHMAFPEGVDSVQIPFTYENGHIYLTATINGKKRVRLILDSGASATIFNSEVVGAMELPVVGTMPARGVGGFVEVKLVKSDSVAIGEITLFDQIGGLMDLTGLNVARNDSLPFGGVVGYDFLSQFPTSIDPLREVVTVYDPEHFVAPQNGYAIPFDLTMQVPTVEASVNGISGRFLIDLGNAMGLILHGPFVEANKLDTLPRIEVGAGRKIGGIGGDVESRMVRIGELRVGEFKLHEIPAVVSAGTSGISGSVVVDGNIGNGILRSYKVVFDYRHQILYLLP